MNNFTFSSITPTPPTYIVIFLSHSQYCSQQQPMKIYICFLLLALRLTSYTQGKSNTQELVITATQQENLGLERSVFGIIPKKRMAKIIHNKSLRINKLAQTFKAIKMHLKKKFKSRRRRRGGKLCSIMGPTNLHFCHRINYNI